MHWIYFINRRYINATCNFNFGKCRAVKYPAKVLILAVLSVQYHASIYYFLGGSYRSSNLGYILFTYG
ncbi:unnamed protein product [Allacma fusca]|uniref:Uncharacterized protein n=1 Tax=Allacma fusca TaxID=39272 RepID=A0A8J2LV66_9HEXA|nr:unnamed protein product [Allacma fusca]